jgi:hypothetical protein
MVQSFNEAHYRLLARRILDGLTDEQRESAASAIRYLMTQSDMRLSYTAERLADNLADAVGADPARVDEVLKKLTSARMPQAVPTSVESNEPGQATRLHDATNVSGVRRLWHALRSQVGDLGQATFEQRKSATRQH